MYVKENGDEDVDPGERTPLPLEDNVTIVALPPKVFSEIVTGLLLHVVPLDPERVTRGGFLQCFCPATSYGPNSNNPARINCAGPISVLIIFFNDRLSKLIASYYQLIIYYSFAFYIL